MTLGEVLGTLGKLMLGGEAIRQVGNTIGLSQGIKSATQSFIGLGILSDAAKNAGSQFKLK